MNEVIQCNDLTGRFGLVLTQAQAIELVETRFFALRDNGRIEFGGGALIKSLRSFVISPIYPC